MTTNSVPIEKVLEKFSLYYFQKNNYTYYSQKNNYNGEFYIGQEICTGGVSGGSCWESSDPREYYTNEEFDIPKLMDDLIEVGLIDKNISFTEGMNFMKGMITFNKNEYEYYGNRSDNSLKCVKIKVQDGMASICSLP